MSALFNTLDQVIAKVLPNVSAFANKYPDDWDSAMWSNLEDLIGHVYRSFLRSLLSDPHIKDLRYVIDQQEAKPLGENVTLCAINHRGLFRQNGRSTLLEPCGAFYPRTAIAKRHEALHHTYMYLVQKAESINQLFLGTKTSLKCLAVVFGEEDEPRIDISRDKLHGTFHISNSLADYLAPTDLRLQWKEVIHRILKEVKPSKILNSLDRKGRLPPELSSLDKSLFRNNPLNPLDVIRQWPKLFRQWLSIYTMEDLQNIEKAGILFGSWLWSISWLMFYCQEDVAGRFFYTIRLPLIDEDLKGVFPESSVSIVTKVGLTEDQLNKFREIADELSPSKGFIAITNLIKTSVRNFRKNRLGLLKKLDKTYKVHNDLRFLLEKLYSGYDLPMDFKRMCFFLNLARCFVGRHHEGESLRFCFIYGFGYDRVNAESNGMLDEYHSPLLPRWLRFLDRAKVAFDADEKDKTKELGESLADWIKGNDLQLQRPDVALYFEEDANTDYPRPSILVQIRRSFPEELHPVSTELELRQALRDLTECSNRTVAVLTGSSGLFVFILGKCLLVRCSGRDDWNDPFYLQITDDGLVLEDQIDTDFKDIFKDTFSDRNEVAEKAAEIVKRLCEALVTMGYGAMFVVRRKEAWISSSKKLRPLNPVWLLRSTVQNSDDLKNECAVFALMAALDGATELLLPSDTNEPIQFYCRRFAQIEPKYRVWKDDKDELGDVILESEADKNMWRLFIGKGTRHHTALLLSRRLSDSLIITISADGPVTVFQDGTIKKPRSKIPIRFAP